MRVLVVHPGPHFSVADVYNGWVRGLRQNGVNVAEFNLGERLDFYWQAHIKQEDGEWRRGFPDKESAYRAAAAGIESVCYEYWPDIVLFVCAFYVPPQVLEVVRSRGHKVVIHHTESPYEDRVQVTRAQYADVNLINDPTNIDYFEAVGAPVEYVPHAYDPAVHRPGPAVPELKSDFCFIGTGFPSRIEFLSSVNWDGIDIMLGGNWPLAKDTVLERFCQSNQLDQCIDNTDTVRFYNSTKVSANLYRKEHNNGDVADGWAMGPREVELAASGTFFLRDSRPESDIVLHMLPTFDSPGDFEEKLRWWLAHDEQRERAALRAREAVADRTFQAHASNLLRLAAD